MNRIMQILLLSFCCLLAIDCKKGESSPTSSSSVPGVVKGNVKDNETGLGVANVAITTQPSTNLIQTDNSGNYMVSNVTPGNYTFTTSKSGYVSQSNSITVNGGDTVIANFSIAPNPPSPGTAKIDASVGNGLGYMQWSTYTTSGSCNKQQDTIIISSSFSLSGLYTNTYTLTLHMVSVSINDTINLGPATKNYITYNEALAGYPDIYTTQLTGTSGRILVTYYNNTEKVIAGTFYGTLTDGSNNMQVSGGTFRGAWQ